MCVSSSSTSDSKVNYMIDVNCNICIQHLRLAHPHMHTVYHVCERVCASVNMQFISNLYSKHIFDIQMQPLFNYTYSDVYTQKIIGQTYIYTHLPNFPSHTINWLFEARHKGHIFHCCLDYKILDHMVYFPDSLFRNVLYFAHRIMRWVSFHTAQQMLYSLSNITLSGRVYLAHYISRMSKGRVSALP